MKKIGSSFFAIFTLSLIFGLFSCNNSSKELILATGGTGGTYYSFGNAIADIWNTNTDNTDVTVLSTSASVENLNLLSSEEADVAIVQNDILDYAYNGMNMFIDPLPNISAIGTMYEETIHIVTLPPPSNATEPAKTEETENAEKPNEKSKLSAKIKKDEKEEKADETNAPSERLRINKITAIDHLRNKRVAVGSANSALEFTAKQIIENYRLSFNSVQKINLSFKESCDYLQNGIIDAFFVSSSVPNSALQELAFANGLVILPINRSTIDSICVKYGFYIPATIPGGTYKGTNYETETVAVKCAIAVNAKLDEATVYELTKTLFENLEELKRNHPKGKEVSAEKALQGLSIPLHPGAEKYFREIGVIN